MNKEQFLSALRARLSDLPASETERPLAFYAESIDDRVEDGMTEEEAVAALGDLDGIVREIEAALPLTTIVKQRVKTERARGEKRGHSAAWIVLAVVGAPVWLPLLITAAALVLTVYIVIWAVIVSLFAVLAALVVAAAALLIYGVAKIAVIGLYGSLMVLGAAAVILGAAVLLEEPIRALAKLLARQTGCFWRWVKRKISGKGGGEG